MLTAGAIGYVVKGGTIDELCAAIRRASSGEAELDQRVLPAAVEDLRRLLEEERLRREQIERLGRSKSEFIQVLSHELRTPLTVISGVLRMLQQRETTPEDADLLESALRRARQLEFLVEGLELVASGPSEKGAASPAQAIQTAVDRLGTAPETVTLEKELWEGVSPQYLHRVAYELLSNAFRHGQRPVEVSARRLGKDGLLVVTDRGGWGVPGDFTAFFQEDMSSTRPQGGLGLGLFVASRLCQACDGDLTVRAMDGLTVAEARFRLRYSY
jgi:signal transduction histidine kinase